MGTLSQNGYGAHDVDPTVWLTTPKPTYVVCLLSLTTRIPEVISLRICSQGVIRLNIPRKIGPCSTYDVALPVSLIRGMKSRANVNSKLGVLGWLQVTMSPTNKASEDYVPSVKILRITSRWYSSKHSAEITPQRNFNCGAHHLLYHRGMCRHGVGIKYMCKCLSSTSTGINLRSPMQGQFEIYSPGLARSLGLRVITKYVIRPGPGPQPYNYKLVLRTCGQFMLSMSELILGLSVGVQN